VPAGERWHGSPARRTDVNYVRIAPTRCSKLRRAMYAALTLIGILFLSAPLLEGGFGLLFFEVSSLIEVLDPSVRSSTGALTVPGLLIEGLAFSAVFLFGAMLVHHCLQVFKYAPTIARLTEQLPQSFDAWPEPLLTYWRRWFLLLKINAALGPIVVLLGLALVKNQ